VEIDKQWFEVKKDMNMRNLVKGFCLLALLFAILLVPLVRAEGSNPLAFPGAEGFGKYAKGGRGGDVYHVTNLGDDGPGSLRYGVDTANHPRTIVFDVAGTIQLAAPIRIQNKSCLTIAGQTAPGKGITIRDHAIVINKCRDIVVRYLRLRLGDKNKEDSPGQDVMTVDYCDQIILDHLSLSWGIDGNSDYRGNSHMTLQWLLYAEALHDSIHPKGAHAMCTSLRDCQGNTTLHHNIYSTSRNRHPTIGGGTGRKGYAHVVVDYRNCVNYNWQGPTNFGGMKLNVVNNYYKPGPCSDPQDLPMQMKDGDTTKARGFMVGNHFEGMAERFNEDNYCAVIYTNSGSYMSTSRERWVSKEPFEMGEFKPLTQNARSAFEACLRYTGCSLVRDRVDERIIKNIVTGKGKLIDSQDEVGVWDRYPEVHRPNDWDVDRDGIPGAWEKMHGLNPADSADRNRDTDGDGYTNLEEYLNSLVPNMLEVMTLDLTVSNRH
jgi:pectate lyase